jgi:hypothetical protein
MGKMTGTLHATLAWSLALALLLPSAAGSSCACAREAAPGVPAAAAEHDAAASQRSCCRRKTATKREIDVKRETHACCRTRVAKSQPVGAKQAIAAELSACSSSSYQVAVCKCHQTDAPAPTAATTAGSAGHKHVTAAHMAPAPTSAWVSTPASPHAAGWGEAPPGSTSLERCILFSRFLI